MVSNPELEMAPYRKYKHYSYNWFLVIPRVVILGPLLIVRTLLRVLTDLLELFHKSLDSKLPVPYTIQMVPFEELSRREKETERELERLHQARIGRMLSQIQTPPTARNDN